MPVEDGRSVEVLGLPEGVDEELLSLYFENKRRSGGGPLTSVEKEGNRALLVFEEAEVAARVLSKGHHVLHNSELTVRKPPLKDPWRLLLRGVNPNIDLELVELYVENMLGMEMDSYSLDSLLERGLVLVHFQQQLSQDFQQLSAKISKKPLDGSKITLEQIEQTDTILVENLPPGISAATLTSYLESTGAGNHKVKEVNVTSPSTARVSFVDFESVDPILNQPHKLEDAELNVRAYFAFLQPTKSLSSLNSGNEVGRTDNARPNVSSLTPAVGADSQSSSQQMALSDVASHTTTAEEAAAEDLMEDLTEEVTEPLTSHVAIPDPLKLALFRISTLPQDIVQAYPNFDIKIRDDGVYVTGPDQLTMDQLKNAILEFLCSIAQTHFPVDAQTAQFLTNKAVRQLLLDTMKERGLPSIYNVVANVVAVSSLSVNHVNQACSLLKSLFCSFSIPVDREYECMLYSEELSGFLQSLEFCSARVSESAGAIEVMTLKRTESDVQEKIVTFLSTPIEREMVISMEMGRLKYIQLHHHQLMADMDQVSIVPLEAEDVCGLKIHGNAMACQMASEVLDSVATSICTRTITSNAPGVCRFLLEDEGPSILAEITTKFKVYISMDKVYWKRIPNEDIFDAAWKMMSQLSFQKVSLDGAQVMEVLTQTGLMEEAKRIVSVIDETMDVAAPSTSDNTGGVAMEDEDLYTAGEPPDQDDDVIETDGGATAGNPPESQSEALRRPPADLEEEAQLSLAIQYSMEYTRSQAEEDDELRKVLELSMKTAKREGPPPASIRPKEIPKQVMKDAYTSMQEEIKAINASQISVFASYTSDLIRTDIALAKKITLRQVEEKMEQKGLKNMSEFHKRCLEVVKRKHAVAIKLQGNMVIISGFKDFVSNALPDLKLLLKKMSSATTDAEILKTLQWVWHDETAATPYAPDTTVFIETAWKMKRKRINLLLNNQPHVIIFDKMEEYNVASGKSVKISRKMLSLMDLGTNVSEEDYSLLSSMPEVARVDEDSDEFQEVVKDFYESIQKYHSKIRIIKVEKLMNRLLYKQYQLKKASIVQSATEPEIERTLYHGTGENSVKEICIHGFNRSFCGKNATVYGQGVYFAVNSALSVQEQYSPPNAEGYKFVFVAKVLTGDYTRGDHSMKTAPLKESDDIPLRYDSVADNITTPTMFVIFNDTQAYPEYLITCQKIHR